MLKICIHPCFSGMSVHTLHQILKGLMTSFPTKHERSLSFSFFSTLLFEHMEVLSSRLPNRSFIYDLLPINAFITYHEPCFFSTGFHISLGSTDRFFLDQPLNQRYEKEAFCLCDFFFLFFNYKQQARSKTVRIKRRSRFLSQRKIILGAFILK